MRYTIVFRVFGLIIVLYTSYSMADTASTSVDITTVNKNTVLTGNSVNSVSNHTDKTDDAPSADVFTPTPGELTVSKQLDAQREQLDAISQQIKVLNGQAMLLEAQKNYKKAEGKNNDSTLLGDPHYWKTEWVMGFEGHREASLLTDSGLIRVKQGTEIGQGWVVHRIRGDGVIVERSVTSSRHEQKRVPVRHLSSRYRVKTELVTTMEHEDFLVPLLFIEDKNRVVVKTDDGKTSAITASGGTAQVINRANLPRPPPL